MWTYISQLLLYNTLTLKIFTSQFLRVRNPRVAQLGVLAQGLTSFQSSCWLGCSLIKVIKDPVPRWVTHRTSLVSLQHGTWLSPEQWSKREMSKSLKLIYHDFCILLVPQMIPDTVWQGTAKHKYQEAGYYNLAFKDSYSSHVQNILILSQSSPKQSSHYNIS